MAEKSARKPRVCLWGTSSQVGTNLNAILRGRLFVQMLHRPLSGYHVTIAHVTIAHVHVTIAHVHVVIAHVHVTIAHAYDAPTAL